MKARDLPFMERALELAKAAQTAGEVPVGAVLVIDGEIAGEGGNRPIDANDPTAHAEIQAIRQACVSVGNYRLPGATLYVTLEPCAMCAGAMVHARVKRLVYGAKDPKAGAAGSVFEILRSETLNHTVDVESGALETECAALLREFFAARR